MQTVATVLASLIGLSPAVSAAQSSNHPASVMVISLGQLVVRVDGQWKEVEFSYGVKPLTQ